MEMLMNSDRQYWRGVLAAGGFTHDPAVEREPDARSNHARLPRCSAPW